MSAYIRNDTPGWREQIVTWRNHPVCSRLVKEQMTYQEVRAVWCIYRNGTSYEELVSELAKPNGGELLFGRNIGPKTIEALRRLCSDHLPIEYGYA